MQSILRAVYSSLRLQVRVLRSRSGNGIWRGQDSGVDIMGFVSTPQPERDECFLVFSGWCCFLEGS
jgi:hypothetical protein